MANQNNPDATGKSHTSSGSMERRLVSDVTSSAGSLVYWSSSKDEDDNDLHDAALRRATFSNGVIVQDDEETQLSYSSLADSLFYSEDGNSKLTGIVSYAPTNGVGDSSASVGGDRYFDERSLDGGASLDDTNVYIFTDDDSLSPRDHRLAAHESQIMFLRTTDSSLSLNLPSLLNSGDRRDQEFSVEATSPSNDPHLMWSPITLETPSNIASPTLWQEYNQRKGKRVARRLLEDATTTENGQQLCDELQPTSSSSPSRNSLWIRVAKSWQSQSSKAQRPSLSSSRITRRGGGGGATAGGERRLSRHGAEPEPSASTREASRRVSVVGSWDDEDGSVHCRGASRDGLEGRTSPHEIVEMLDLGDEGRRLVHDLRRAFDPVPTPDEVEASGSHQGSESAPVPSWPVLDGALKVAPNANVHAT